MTPTQTDSKGMQPETVVLTGAEALIRVLTNAGIEDYYGIVGGNLAGIFNAVGNTEGLRYIGCRHEAAGAFMAAAVYNATGRLAVSLGELGPGTLNVVGGLGVAHNNNLPLLAITSAWPDSRVAPLVGTMMELDGITATQAVTKWSTRIPRVDRLPSLTKWAIREALTGRPGPVHLDIPGDVLKAEFEFDVSDLDAPLASFLPSGRTHADPVQVTEAARLIASGRKVLVLAGGGVVHSGAAPEVRELAERLGAAATGTQMAIGVVSTSDPNFIGHAGAIGGEPVLRSFAEADVVVAVGCKFGSWTKSGTTSLVEGWPDQKLIHIDVDPVAIGRAQSATIGLVGDAKAVLRQILESLPVDIEGSDPQWLASLVDSQRTRRKELEALAGSAGLHPAAVAQEFGDFLPADSLVVYDGGHTSFWTNDLTPAYEPGTRFNDSGMAQLGYGIPFALALKAQFPDRPVFNVTGDGSFGFTVAELDTARRYGLNIVTVIHNNESWGVIERGQRAAGFELGAVLSGTDYAAIAKGFGCYGEIVTERDEIAPALQRALDSGLPAVLDIRTRFETHPNMAAFGATLA